MARIDPTTERTLPDLPWHIDEQVQSLLARSGDAFLQWRHTPLLERGRMMHRAAQVLRDRVADLALMMTHEMGKPIAAAEAEVEKCADCCEYFAFHSARYLAEIEIASDANAVVCAIRSHWRRAGDHAVEFPVLAGFSIRRAGLMAGNVGVLKHAPNVPGCARGH